ncbi:50S ribosomal protein L11 [Candidatus Nomurabacteria bacterium]|uniref:Large ribosomal subunit protein uL11 n=1 Tax=candidate division WWE3 bacterium TaxID=2053526 RepID=A0A955IVT9_UNCKA|nr:50S ribosomal protein L11 [candidate division WWE3 bacterium]MCB9823635.1 50S ribosomal protein L11 [Candidatus Nomurabacteria bacterium]MCB9827287.1 50S ribosomal protein L11 [Candidatus Nomurabacteria bacterium]MCB9827430.1 50S ribosomal protein L11 [Candidatus Nomurabacteria bacterium]HXK52928.1 50S ribosomal protein L11 [bacterium]
MAEKKKKGKKIKGYIKLNIPAAQATPAPPIGPALGQHGVPLMDFCKEFNARTASMAGNIIPVVITVFEDKSFTFITKTPVTSDLIKKALKVQKGAANNIKEKVGTLSKSQIEDIAKTKMPDLNTDSLEEAVKIIEGTARSMGVKVENA